MINRERHRQREIQPDARDTTKIIFYFLLEIEEREVTAAQIAETAKRKTLKPLLASILCLTLGKERKMDKSSPFIAFDYKTTKAHG